MQFPGVDFIYIDLLKPDHDAFNPIREDVLNQWRGTRTLTLRGSSSRRFKLQTPLDGTATFDVSGGYRLRVLAGGRALKARAAGGSYTICAERSLSAQLTRTPGAGSFTVNLP